jgi:hypothetical protein
MPIKFSIFAWLRGNQKVAFTSWIDSTMAWKGVQLLLLGACLLLPGTSAESSSLVAAPPSAPSPQVEGGKTNVASQLVGGIKEWFVSYGNAFKQMRMDHNRCNVIRQKQNRYKSSLRQEWEELGIDPKEIRTRLSKVSGGITFDEFLFLRKGKGDREKLISLVFYASFLPKMMPYMLMFNAGNMLPDQFPKKQTFFGETKREALSRERCHAVLNMLMTLERRAHVQGFSINPFGGSKQRKAMEQYQEMKDAIQSFLVQNQGPDSVMKILEDKIFLSEKPKGKEIGLATMPSVFTRGLATAVSGNSNRVLNGLIPNFIDRTSLLSHIKAISQSDEFLVNQAVDLDALAGATLVEACSDRLIHTLGSTEAEMRTNLATWLRYAAIIPSRRTRKTGEHYNGNLARSALMCYFALDSVRNRQSASVLPRVLMQSSGGQRVISD